MSENKRRIAKTAAKKIVEDLGGRSGFDLFDSLEDCILEEILDTMAGIIEDAMSEIRKGEL